MTSTTAVVLLAMGGPDCLENVEPYLIDVRGGRPTPPEIVEEVKERYRATGGRSPVLGITRSLAAKLEALRPGWKVVVGLRHWQPRIAEAWAEAVASGAGRAVGIPMAPHNSAATVDRYAELLADARRASGAHIPLGIVTSWATHTALVDALAGTVLTGVARFGDDERAGVAVLFTAHSLPRRVADAGDPYPDEVAATVRAVAERLGGLEGAGRPWRFAYQSQGRTADPWLGPTVPETLADMAADGCRSVLVAPVGFLSDHVEINYDVDIEFKTLAGQLGIHLERTPMLNDSDALVAVLAALVDEQLAR
ncbi:MAG: ferrochelatase [Acidimicrobiia bacterium]